MVYAAKGRGSPSDDLIESSQASSEYVKEDHNI